MAHGINQSPVELIDITRPEARKQQLQISENELLIVGVPVSRTVHKVPER
jgi:hypothetical protein